MCWTLICGTSLSFYGVFSYAVRVPVEVFLPHYHLLSPLFYSPGPSLLALSWYLIPHPSWFGYRWTQKLTKFSFFFSFVPVFPLSLFLLDCWYVTPTKIGLD